MKRWWICHILRRSEDHNKPKIALSSPLNLCVIPLISEGIVTLADGHGTDHSHSRVQTAGWKEAQKPTHLQNNMQHKIHSGYWQGSRYNDNLEASQYVRTCPLLKIDHRKYSIIFAILVNTFPGRRSIGPCIGPPILSHVSKLKENGQI